MKKIIIASLFIVLHASLSGQRAGVGIGTTTPEAVLDLVSNKKGILIPRQTATQIQAIAVPGESELLYSTTNDGSIINKKGFWYFRAGSWRPLLENSSTLNNTIYTSDGTVISNREIAQNGMFLNIGPDLLYITGNASTVGMFTTSPTQALDVNGQVRIQTINKTGNVTADTQGVLIQDTDYFDIGDVKPSYSTSDHNGWYLLNGRPMSALPLTAQQNAANILGITNSLPDAAGKYSIGATNAPGTDEGSNTVVLTRNNFPVFNFIYSTDTTGGHGHNVTYDLIRTNTVNGGPNNIHAYWISGSIVGGLTYARASASISHNHTYTVSSGGSAAPVDIRPRALHFNYFIYLGS